MTNWCFYWDENTKVVLPWHMQTPNKILRQRPWLQPMKCLFQSDWSNEIITEKSRSSKDPTKIDISIRYPLTVLLIRNVFYIFPCRNHKIEFTKNIAFIMISRLDMTICTCKYIHVLIKTSTVTLNNWNHVFTPVFSIIHVFIQDKNLISRITKNLLPPGQTFIWTNDGQVWWHI